MMIGNLIDPKAVNQLTCFEKMSGGFPCGVFGGAMMLICIGLPACDGNGGTAGFWAVERERIELEQQLKLAEYRIGTAHAGDADELARIHRNLDGLQKRVRDLQQSRSLLEAEIMDMENRNAEFARAAIHSRRMEVAGSKLESLSLKDGRVLENVTVASVDDSGVALRHEHGAARLRYADLTSSQQAFFGLEADSALAAEAREQVAASAYEKQLDAELQVVRDKEEQRERELARRDENARISSAFLARNSISSYTRPLAKPATQFGNGSWSRGWYRSCRPTYRYVYYPSAPSYDGSRLRSIDPMVPVKKFTNP